MAGHTPGPWRYEEDDYGHVITMGSRLGDPSHWAVQHEIEYQHGLDPSYEPDTYAFAEAEANARLIVAAPDLLAAAKVAVKKCGGADYEAGREALLAAIAKAEGKP